MKYRRRLNVMLAIVGIFAGIFFILVDMCDAQPDFAKLGININFILSLILGSILFYWTFEVRARKKSLLECIAWFIASINYFLLAICNYYKTWYTFREICSIVTIFMWIIVIIIFLFINYRDKKFNRYKS